MGVPFPRGVRKKGNGSYEALTTYAMCSVRAQEMAGSSIFSGEGESGVALTNAGKGRPPSGLHTPVPGRAECCSRPQVPEARERLINHTSLASPTSSPRRQATDEATDISDLEALWTVGGQTASDPRRERVGVALVSYVQRARVTGSSAVPPVAGPHLSCQPP